MSQLLSDNNKFMGLKVQSLIYKLNEVFEGEPWFGDSLMSRLNEIDYKLVNKKLTNSNSIAILVQHLINWRIFAVEKLEGNESFDIELNSEKDWTNIVIKSKKEWDELLDQLIATQNKMIDILKQQENDFFLSQMVSGRAHSFEYLIEGIIQHDIYHFGQIELLAKTYSLFYTKKSV